MKGLTNGPSQCSVVWADPTRFSTQSDEGYLCTHFCVLFLERLSFELVQDSITKDQFSGAEEQSSANTGTS